MLVAPAVDNRIGGQVLSVPQRGYPSALTEYSAPREDRVTAHSFGLPSDQDLRALLSNNPRVPAHASAAQPANSGAAPVANSTGAQAARPFYFLEPQRAPNGYAGTYPEGKPDVDTSRHPAFDVNAVRRDFPILQERVNGKQLVWFDNAATTHKPRAVIDRISYFYEHENSNIHRAAHELAARATDAYEGAREKVRNFLGAGNVDEIIFVRGATEGINLVAKTWGVQNVLEGDEIIVSNLEHHANIVPWQQLAALKGAKLRVIPVDDSGQVLIDEYKKLLNDRTKIVAVTQVSNALGTVVPVKEIVELAHRAGAIALVDGAQSVSHMRVNVQDIGADFFVFSGHKVFGPTGIGVVYGKRELLDAMPPWQGGGNMIADVTFERTVFQPPPNKFEAGTGNIADAVGLGAAIDYVQRIGLENIARYEHDLLAYATHLLKPIPGVRLIGTAHEKASVLSFVLKGYTT
jgi:cysteine desulfurase/selenocysteine lyase